MKHCVVVVICFELTLTLNSLKMKKQVIKTPMDDYALSNAVIKCLTNLGGKVAILDDMMCPKDTYFIGMITRMLRKVILN